MVVYDNCLLQSNVTPQAIVLGIASPGEEYVAISSGEDSEESAQQVPISLKRIQKTQGGVWWCMVVYGGVWWCMVVYGGVCSCVCAGSLLKMYVGAWRYIWWFMVVNDIFLLQSDTTQAAAPVDCVKATSTSTAVAASLRGSTPRIQVSKSSSSDSSSSETSSDSESNDASRKRCMWCGVRWCTVVYGGVWWCMMVCGGVCSCVCVGF